MEYGLSAEQLKNRSQHDKVDIEDVRDGSRKRAIRVVVTPDRRIIEKLADLGLWGAFESINKAVSVRTSGLGVKAMDLSAVRGGSGDNGIEYGAELLARYDEWIEKCKKKHFSPRMVLDMVIEGLSLRQIDKKYKFMSGTASKNLIRCLELWR